MVARFRPNAIERYSFDANNNIVFHTLERLFDVAREAARRLKN